MCYVQVDKDNVYGVVFDPTSKSLTVRHRISGWVFDKTYDKVKFTAFFASNEETPKKPTKAWGSD